VTDVSIIIPVKSYEILVIDNGSTDNTVDVAESGGATVHVVPDATVAGLRNFGAEKANGRLLAFIDADCTVAPNWFETLQTYIDNQSVICFGNPPGIPANATWVQDCWYQIRKKGSPEDPPQTVEWLESMNLFVRKDDFDQIGGFDTSLVTCEDYDFGVRVGQQGSILCDPSLEAIHHGEAHNITRFYKKERWRGVSNIAGIRKHGLSISELPSVLFPIAQWGAIIIFLILSLLALLGSLSPWWPIALILLWQIPLLAMSYRKGHSSNKLKHTAGIWALLNVYFTARGQSMLMGAAWR